MANDVVKPPIPDGFPILSQRGMKPSGNFKGNSVVFWDSVRTSFPKEYDWLVSLVNSFREQDEDCVVLESRLDQNRFDQFRLEACLFADELGLLYQDNEAEAGSDDKDSTAYTFHLTMLGKRVILDPAAPSEYVLPSG